MNKPPVRLDLETQRLIITDLVVTDSAVVREAARWTDGVRGPAVSDPERLGAADLSAFATEAVAIGAHALAATGQTAEVRAIEQLLTEVGSKTPDATTRAAELTDRSAKDAAESLGKATNDVKKAFTETEREQRKELGAVVEEAKKGLSAEVRKLFGGDNPELLDRLQPVLDKFGVEINKTVTQGTSALIEKTARQFDPADPTSPVAKHNATIAAEQKRLVEVLEKQHTELAAKVEDLLTAVRVQEARATLANVTPIKGDSFEADIHALMRTFATGAGDDYADTGHTVGRLPRSKKGDGVLIIAGGAARVVVEVTDSARNDWTTYFDEAERNRDAAAALGIVRTTEQNAHQSIRILGPRRIVIAFDPASDNPEMVRTVILLLRTAALASAQRTGDAEIATAGEKISAALTELSKIDSIKKIADTIQKNAGKIDSECVAVSAGIRRLLDDALAALAGAESAPTPSIDPRSERGAA